ncbi:hypothetical protein [Bradyrhizobium australafricanum]|uniref:hypothetical protein n=1 Tax=Bradyrhizobium australafricanum TaxID=2821406 RepID=UPI001CE23BD3|nr:hypothetical protein [Bradyrhizobium australafricanum]MCA6098151.1 hypothetical protein [Bradyrhizobium australafricanum]
MTTYTKPGRFPPASMRYGKPTPVELKFAPPEEAGERDEDGRLLLATPLAPPPRPPTTVMPPPNLRAGGIGQLPRAMPVPARAGGKLPPVTGSPEAIEKALREARRQLRERPIMPDDIPW